MPVPAGVHRCRHFDDAVSLVTVIDVTERTDVLVIEDDPDTQRLFMELLRDAGMVTHGCRQDALPERNGFSAVLTDLGPGLQSMELARQWIRLLRLRYQAPVIVVSGLTFVDGELEGVAADVISKPVDIDDLVRRVSSVLARGKTAA